MKDRVVLPFDVLCEVISWADSDSLQVLSLLNQECNAETNKYIWRHINVLTGVEYRPDLGLDKPTSYIARDARRAACITTLKLDIFSNTFDPDIPAPLCDLLKFTPSLRRLKIRVGRAYASSISKFLAQNCDAYSFRLKELRSNLPASNDFHVFLSKHPTIEVYHQHPADGTVAAIQSGAFPLLKEVSSDLRGVRAIVKISGPLSSIQVILAQISDVFGLVQLFDEFPRVAAGVQEFRLFVTSRGIIGPVLAELPSRLTTLQTLELHDDSWLMETAPDATFSLSPLKHHPTLQRIKSYHPLLARVQDVYTNVALYQCPTLRRVEMTTLPPWGSNARWSWSLDSERQRAR